MPRKCPTYRWWTSGEIEQAKAMLGSGRTYAETARRLGRTVYAVTNMAQRKGGLRPLRSPRWLAWRDVLASDTPDREIAARMGCRLATVSTMRFRLKKTGVLTGQKAGGGS